MKTFNTDIRKFAVLAAVAFTLAAASNSSAQGLPEVRARIGLKQGGNPAGVIQNSRPDAIQFSTREGVAGQVLPFANIKGEGLDLQIQLEGGAEALAPGRSAFADGDFEAAAEEFAKVVKAFPNIVYIPHNFATEAAWYQVESLRRAGKFSDIAAALESTAAKTIPSHIAEAFQKQFGYNKIWAIYGSGDMDALKSAIAPASVAVSDLLPTDDLKTDLPENEQAQMAFLRAKIAEAAGEKDKALNDYYRAFTLNFGSDKVLSKQAMLAALAIHKEDPSLENEKNKLPLQQIQGLAFQFKNTYGISELPSDYALYAVRPDLPQMAIAAPPTEETDEKPAADDAKGAAPDGAKGDDAKGKAEPTKGESEKGKAKAE